MKSNLMNKTNSAFTGQTAPANEINEILKDAKNILVASHVDPDGDALGSQLAFKKYLEDKGYNVILVRDNEIPEKYQFLKGIEKIPHYNELPKDIAIDTAIILECPNLSRIGSAVNLLNDDIVVINIDHHRDNDGFGKLCWFNIEASSVGEMVYEYFEQMNYTLDTPTAEQLYVALLTDTGRFRYRSTTSRTMEIAAILLAAGVDPLKSCDSVYYNMKPSSMMLIGKVLNDIKFFKNQKLCLISMSMDMLSECGADYSESDGLVDYTLYNNGVVVGAFVKETPKGNIKVSLRSRDGINVAAFAAEFGGGGHFNAAGCSLEMSLEKAIELISTKLSEVIDG